MPKGKKTTRTGDTCEEEGIYETSCADKVTQEIKIREKFPPCPACSNEVNWTPKVM